MKTLFIALFALISVDAMACRPMIPAIEHRLILNAIDAVYEEKMEFITNLTAKKVDSMDFYWIKTNAGYQCHDREIAVVSLAYTQNGVTKAYKVEIQADEAKVTSTKVTEVTATAIVE